MRGAGRLSKIYSSIELGTDSIKVVVLEKIKNQFHLLASSCVKSQGIKKCEIVDTKAVTKCVRSAIKEVEEVLGVKISKILLTVPSKGCIFNIVSGCVDIVDKNSVSGVDVSNVLTNAITGNVHNDYEVVTAVPICFKVDNGNNIKDPKGLRGNKLSSKIVICELPKEILYKYLAVIDLCGLEVVDLAFSSVGDYYAVSNSNLDKSVGAIINIGEDTCNVSVFNKGIMIKNKVINVGSYYVDHDLSYIYKIDLKEARNLKENFVVACERYADIHDSIKVKTEAGEIQVINQLDASKVVEARIVEILKVAKSEIKNLTNRQISYIIVVGGLSELAGFQYLADATLGHLALVFNSTAMGIRHNKYTSVYGVIKYFDSKLELRGKNCDMFNTSDIDKLISMKNKDMNDIIVKKLFGQFLENKEEKVC